MRLSVDTKSDVDAAFGNDSVDTKSVASVGFGNDVQIPNPATPRHLITTALASSAFASVS